MYGTFAPKVIIIINKKIPQLIKFMIHQYSRGLGARGTTALACYWRRWRCCAQGSSVVSCFISQLGGKKRSYFEAMVPITVTLHNMLM